MAKKYEELSFTDNFMFCKIMSAYPEIAKGVLELILGIKIKRIGYPETEKSIEIKDGARGIRMDAFVITDSGKRIDIEMQSRWEKNIPKRMRYYQAVQDLNFLEKGEDYEKLPESIVIFILKKAPFEGNRYKYTFENICIEEGGIRLKDGTKQILVNASGDDSEAPEEMKDFLGYIRGESEEGELVRKIVDAVEEARQNNKWSMEFMSLNAHLMDAGSKGVRKGIKKGRKQGRKQGLKQGEQKKAKGVYDKLFGTNL